MSRHRNVRSMNYSDEYDGYDDVYGHSVEDDYTISPSDASFMYDRSRQQSTQISNFLREEDDIAEEDESFDSDSLLERRNSEHFKLPILNEIDGAKLQSCLDEVHSVVGDSVAESILIETIISCQFDLTKSLDTILKNQTSSIKEAPKPQRIRKLPAGAKDDVLNNFSNEKCMLKLSKKVQLNSDHLMVEHVNDIVKTNCLHEFCKKQSLSNVNNTFSNKQCLHTTNIKPVQNSEISNLIEKHVLSNDALVSQNQEIKDGHKCESLETSKALKNKTQINLSYKFNKGMKNIKSVPKMITYCSKKNCMEESVLEDAPKSMHRLMYSANAQSNDLHECGMREQSLDHCKNTSNNDCDDEPFSLLVLASTHRDKQKPPSLLNDILSARDNIADNSDLFIASNRFYAQNEVKSLKDILVTNTNESNSTTFSPCIDSDEEDHFSLAHLAAKHNKHNQQESTLDDLVSKHLNSNTDTFISEQKLIADLELSMEPQCFSEINSDDFNTISQLAKKQLISYESKINKEDLSKTLLNQDSKSSIYSEFTNTSPASISIANDSSVRNTNSNFSNDLLFGSYGSNCNINSCEKTCLSECQGQGNIDKDDDVDRNGLEINLSSALITTSFTEHIPSVSRNEEDVTHPKNITSLKTVSNPIKRIDCLNDNNDWKLRSLTETASVKYVEVCCIDATHILKGKLDLRAKKCSSFGKTICKNIKKLQNILSKEESVKQTIILPFSFECPSPDDNILKYTLRRNIL